VSPASPVSRVRSPAGGGRGRGVPWPSWLLAAYPPGWRARYGGELEALVLDLHEGGRRPVPMAIDLLRGAAAAWFGAKRGFAMPDRSRSALYTVLWSWVAFAAVAAWFGHDLPIFPDRALASQIAVTNPGVPDAYNVLLAAGIVGCAATAVAAVAFAIAAARQALARRDRRTFLLMAVPPVAAAAWVGGLKLLPSGPQLQAADRAGLAVLWLLLGVAGLAASTQAVITIARSCEADERTWRIGGVMATVVTAAMLVATGATIAWGVVLRGTSLSGGPLNGWLLVTVIMGVTTGRAVIALVGSRLAGRSPAERPATA